MEARRIWPASGRMTHYSYVKLFEMNGHGELCWNDIHVKAARQNTNFTLLCTLARLFQCLECSYGLKCLIDALVYACV